MWACCCLTTAVFAVLALQSSLPAQAQECRPSSGREAFHLGWPYTAEYHDKNGTIVEGKPGPIKEDVTVVAEDSQGRFFMRFTTPDGRSRTRVLDPVAGQEIRWNTDSTKAKILKYATPVAGRPSCWRGPSSSERSPSTGRSWIEESQAACSPAGQKQPLSCRDICEAERLAKALPPEKNGFPKCDAALGETTEDLGMSVIKDIAAHGCRTTRLLPKEGNVLIENWSDDYGLTLREIQERSNGLKSLRELISLSRDEPSLSIFQPPRGYEIVTLEMQEVPCKPP